MCCSATKEFLPLWFSQAWFCFLILDLGLVPCLLLWDGYWEPVLRSSSTKPAPARWALWSQLQFDCEDEMTDKWVLQQFMGDVFCHHVSNHDFSVTGRRTTCTLKGWIHISHLNKLNHSKKIIIISSAKVKQWMNIHNWSLRWQTCCQMKWKYVSNQSSEGRPGITVKRADSQNKDNSVKIWSLCRPWCYLSGVS